MPPHRCSISCGRCSGCELSLYDTRSFPFPWLQPTEMQPFWLLRFPVAVGKISFTKNDDFIMRSTTNTLCYSMRINACVCFHNLRICKKCFSATQKPLFFFFSFGIFMFKT